MFPDHKWQTFWWAPNSNSKALNLPGLCLSFLKAYHTHYISKFRSSLPNSFSLITFKFCTQIKNEKYLHPLYTNFPQWLFSSGEIGGEPKKMWWYWNLFNLFPAKYDSDKQSLEASFIQRERRKLYTRSHLLLQIWWPFKEIKFFFPITWNKKLASIWSVTKCIPLIWCTLRSKSPLTNDWRELQLNIDGKRKSNDRGGLLQTSHGTSIVTKQQAMTH